MVVTSVCEKTSASVCFAAANLCPTRDWRLAGRPTNMSVDERWLIEDICSSTEAQNGEGMEVNWRI